MGLELHQGLQVSREAFLYFWMIGLVQVGRWERPAKALLVEVTTSKYLWAASHASGGESPPRHHMLVDSVLPLYALHRGSGASSAFLLSPWGPLEGGRKGP